MELCSQLSDPLSSKIAVPLVCFLNVGDVKKKKFINVHVNSKSFLNSGFFFSIVCFKLLLLLHISYI